MKKRGIVFVLSDLLDEKPFENELKLLHLRHDVIVLRLSDPREAAWPGKLAAVLEDAESGEISDFRGSAAAVRRLDGGLTELARERRELCRRARTDMAEIADSGDILRPVIELFARRARRLRR